MAKAATARKRVEVSDQTLALIQELADWYGHGDTKAALATLAKFGVPQLLGQGSLPVNSNFAQTQSQLTAPEHQGKKVQEKATQVTGQGFSTRENSLAHQLGFRHLNERDGLVADVFSEGSRAGYSEREKGSWQPVSDDCVMALANNLEDF